MPVVTKRVAKRKPGPGWWSEKEKLEVVAAYLGLGNLRLVAATCNVPEVTVRKWKASPWWKEAEDELRRSSKIELSGRLKRILDATLPQLEDRIVNGDFYYNIRSRQMERKPLAAHTLLKATATVLDRQMVVEKAATEDRQSDEGLAERLKQLASEMARFAKAKTIEGEVLPTQPTLGVIDAEEVSRQPEVVPEQIA